MAKKKTPTMSQEEAVNTALSAINDLKAKYPDTRTNEQAVLDDYYNRMWAKQGLKNVSGALGGNSGVGPNPQSMFNMLFTKKSTDYLKGVKNPKQLAGVTKPNYVAAPTKPASNATSNTSNATSNTASNFAFDKTPLPSGPANAPSYVGSSDWEDIVNHYFPKGAGNYKAGGKVSRSKTTQTYADGGLVRGGGKALRGRGRGKMV